MFVLASPGLLTVDLVPTQEVFRAFLVGISTTAQQDTAEACPYVSFSGNLALHFNCSHGQVLRCGLKSRAGFLISDSMILIECRSTENDFTVRWVRRPIAEGYHIQDFISQKPQQQLNETDGTVVKKESDSKEAEVGPSTEILFIIKASA